MCDVTHGLTPSPCHKLSHFLTPLSPLERDVLYGRPLIPLIVTCVPKRFDSDGKSTFIPPGRVLDTPGRVGF